MEKYLFSFVTNNKIQEIIDIYMKKSFWHKIKIKNFWL